MRFLDLDLDFFLNKNAYLDMGGAGRLDSKYRAWSVSKVRHFLEERCSLSADTPIPGRTLDSHEEVFDFWRVLIESKSLKVPFEVIHIDAHPDIWGGGGLHLASGLLLVDQQRGLVMLKQKDIHAGNYLTFAMVNGWISSIVWIPLLKHMKDLPKWDADARSIIQAEQKGVEGHLFRDLPAEEREHGIPFAMLPWHEFRTSQEFDYIALSRSPNYTPPESDRLVSVIEEYMKPL